MSETSSEISVSVNKELCRYYENKVNHQEKTEIRIKEGKTEKEETIKKGRTSNDYYERWKTEDKNKGAVWDSSRSKNEELKDAKRAKRALTLQNAKV